MKRVVKVATLKGDFFVDDPSVALVSHFLDRLSIPDVVSVEAVDHVGQPFHVFSDMGRRLRWFERFIYPGLQRKYLVDCGLASSYGVRIPVKWCEDRLTEFREFTGKLELGFRCYSTFGHFVTVSCAAVPTAEVKDIIFEVDGVVNKVELFLYCNSLLNYDYELVEKAS